MANQIFHFNQLLVASSSACSKSFHCVPIQIWISFKKNVERQGGGVALGIATVVLELEVSVTLWGERDEVKCGIDVIAVWHFL